MGSATTQALAASATSLDAQTVTLDTARELFAAARVVGDSSHLSGALADPSASVTARQALVAAVFGPTTSAATVAVLSTAVSQRWSSASDLVNGVEELAIRAAAIASPETDLEGELFGVSRVVADNPELELALGSRLGDSTAKGALIEKLLAGQTSEVTSLVVSSLVRQPRERRVRQLLSRAMTLVSQQRGGAVATVTVAKPLTDEQARRLTASLTKTYGREISLNVVTDPRVVGGIRVQIADDVIDGSVSSRLADVRQKLAG